MSQRVTLILYYYKKFELTLTRCAKASSSSCSQTASLSPAILLQFILGLCVAAENYFGSSGSFKVIDLHMTKKLVTSACCNRQHAHAYLQPFSWKTPWSKSIKFCLKLSDRWSERINFTGLSDRRSEGIKLCPKLSDQQFKKGQKWYVQIADLNVSPCIIKIHVQKKLSAVTLNKTLSSQL